MNEPRRFRFHIPDDDLEFVTSAERPPDGERPLLFGPDREVIGQLIDYGSDEDGNLIGTVEVNDEGFAALIAADWPKGISIEPVDDTPDTE